MADQIKLAEYLYARMKNPIRIKIAHEDGGNYRIFDGKGNIVQTGWIAEGGTLDERNFEIMMNLREASEVALSQPTAIQRFIDLLTFNDARPHVTLSGVIIPERKVAEGVLISSVSFVWVDIVEMLKGDWSKAHEIPSNVWRR